MLSANFNRRRRLSLSGAVVGAARNSPHEGVIALSRSFGEGLLARMTKDEARDAHCV